MTVLRDKMYKDYAYTSRYIAFPYYYHSIDHKYVYGITAYLDDSTPYTAHTVKRNDTIDTLALEYYNNPTLYWIICSFNHIQNPYTKLVEGSIIKIPSISTLKYNKAGRV